jgi:hypothetical protein
METPQRAREWALQEKIESPPREVWVEEKAACIDWTSVPDVLSGNFSLPALIEFHPVLREMVRAADLNLRLKWAYALLSPEPFQRESAVKDLMDRGVFTLRTDRWCACCGEHGHSAVTCQLDVNPEASGKDGAAASPGL